MSNKPNWEQIKEEYERGESLSVLAQTYGVKANTIKGRKQREKWQRLEDKETNYSNIDDFIYGFGYDYEKLEREIIPQQYIETMPPLEKLSAVNTIALGLGLMRKVTAKYNNVGKVVSTVIINIPPNASEIKEAHRIMRRIEYGDYR